MNSLALRLNLFALCAAGCESRPVHTDDYRSPVTARIRLDAPRIHEFLCGGTLSVSTGGAFVHRRADGAIYANEIQDTDTAPGSCILSMRTGERFCALAPAYNDQLSLYFCHRLSRPFTIDSCRELAHLVEVGSNDITSDHYVISPLSVEADGNGCVYQLEDP